MERDTILLIHSILGVMIFVIGVLQILLPKGGKRHIILGNIYLHSWLLLLISGAYLGGMLITIIGIFGYYFTLTGSRIAHLKNKSITIFEKGIFILGLIVALAMLYYSVQLFLRGNSSFWIVFAVFGALFLLTTVTDIRKYIYQLVAVSKYGNMDWYFEHMRRMSISFIAALTAFTSIQDVFHNNTINFLMPTAIGLILIKWAEKKYSKKFGII